MREIRFTCIQVGNNISMQTPVTLFVLIDLNACVIIAVAEVQQHSASPITSIYNDNYHDPFCQHALTFRLGHGWVITPIVLFGKLLPTNAITLLKLEHGWVTTFHHCALLAFSIQVLTQLLHYEKVNNWINTTTFASLWPASNFMSKITKPIPDNLHLTWFISPSSHLLVFNNTTVVISKLLHLWNIRPEADLNDTKPNGVDHIKSLAPGGF